MWALGRARDRLADLRREIDAVLSAHIQPGVRVALIGAPDHFNVGDSILWLGERAWLRAHGGRCVYLAPFGRVDVRAARRAVGTGGQILFHAGGWLTDSWPESLMAFVEVLDEIVGVPVVVLPQSIHFRDPRSAATVREAVERHGRVTILVRDRASLARATAMGLADVWLCPDMGFVDAGFEDRRARRRDAPDALVLRRGDSEAGESRDAANDREWVSPPLGPTTAVWAAARTLWRAAARAAPALAGDPRLGGRLVDLDAHLAVRRGKAIVDRARLVVTDRLHVALLGYLRGCDVVAVESATGKVHDVLGTWLAEEPGVHLVAGWAEARAHLDARAIT